MQKKSSKVLFDYWNELRGSRSAPDRRNLDPTRIREVLANTFILEAEDETAYRFRLAGSHLCATYCRELKSRSFTGLWHAKDVEAMETLVRAVTEDHAVALITFQGHADNGSTTSFEMILLPLRHNGNTTARMLGALTALDTPYWLGSSPILGQRVTGLRLIWPDDPEYRPANIDTEVERGDVAWVEGAGPTPVPARVFGNEARRYAHLAVIDGGRS